MLLAASTHAAAARNAHDPADTSAKVDRLFEPFREGVQPGANVLVVQDGSIVHEGAYGHADLERGIPLTVESTFRLDSVSKQFTSMAVMRLAEDGKLGYDDPVSRYVPALATYPGVTVRHLLTHTGGLPEYYDVIDTARGWPSNADAAKLLGAMAKPVFEPGTRYEYSNPGYDMLAQVVEGASGVRFADFVRERIFVPLGMSHSLVHDHTRPTVPRRVLGYDKTDKGFALDDEHPLNGIVGSGGVFTTLGDLYLWDQALARERLVSARTLEQAFTPYVLENGESTGYGFGWRIDEYRGMRRIHHGGRWVGFRSHIARYPDAHLTIVILANRSDVEPAGYVDKITDLYAPGDAHARGDTMQARGSVDAFRSGPSRRSGPSLIGAAARGRQGSVPGAQRIGDAALAAPGPEIEAALRRDAVNADTLKRQRLTGRAALGLAGRAHEIRVGCRMDLALQTLQRSASRDRCAPTSRDPPRSRARPPSSRPARAARAARRCARSGRAPRGAGR
jgi:CubicO group peptidase (beta-lactamase class C family)